MRGAGGIINERKKKIEITILQKLHGRCYMKTHATAVRIKKNLVYSYSAGEKKYFLFFFAQTSKRSKNHTHSTLVVLYSCCFFS